LTLISIVEIVLRPHRQSLQYVEVGRLFGRRMITKHDGGPTKLHIIKYTISTQLFKVK